MSIKYIHGSGNGEFVLLIPTTFAYVELDIFVSGRERVPSINGQRRGSTEP